MEGADSHQEESADVEFVHVDTTLSESEYTAIHQQGAANCIGAEESQTVHEDYIDAAMDAVTKLHDSAETAGSDRVRVETTFQRYELEALEEVARSVGSAQFLSAVTTVIRGEVGVDETRGYELDVYIHPDIFHDVKDAVTADSPNSTGERVLIDLLDAAETELVNDGLRYSLDEILVESELRSLDAVADGVDPTDERESCDARLAALLVDVATPVEPKDPLVLAT